MKSRILSVFLLIVCLFSSSCLADTVEIATPSSVALIKELSGYPYGKTIVSDSVSRAAIATLAMLDYRNDSGVDIQGEKVLVGSMSGGTSVVIMFPNSNDEYVCVLDSTIEDKSYYTVLGSMGDLTVSQIKSGLEKSFDILYEVTPSELLLAAKTLKEALK